MKIHQLPLGARFEYEGEEYRKTGPLFATGQDGGQRLIPKYAQLKVLGESEPSRGGKTGAPTQAAILEAFAAFYATSRQLVPGDRHAELDAARERFLKAVGAAL